MKLLFLFILSLQCFAKEDVYKFHAIAYNEKGEIAYKELHEEIYEAGKIKQARTFYIRKGRNFATERTYFENGSMALPTVEVVYPGDTETYEGAKYEKDDIVIYRKIKGEPHESALYQKSELTLVGQGIHYYLREHLDEVKSSGEISFRYLIPARLTHFTFRYKFLKEEKGLYHIKIELNSWLVRFLAPTFTAVYDSSNKRIVSYEGVSNWKDDKGRLQTVKIKYEYP
jgi:hypothetical protein